MKDETCPLIEFAWPDGITVVSMSGMKGVDASDAALPSVSARPLPLPTPKASVPSDLAETDPSHSAFEAAIAAVRRGRSGSIVRAVPKAGKARRKRCVRRWGFNVITADFHPHLRSGAMMARRSEEGRRRPGGTRAGLSVGSV